MTSALSVFPASKVLQVRTGQVVARHGFEPEAFRVVVVSTSGTLADAAADSDGEGFLEVSVTRPYVHTALYRRSASWLEQFERDLAGGGFNGPCETPPRLCGGAAGRVARTLCSEELPGMQLRVI